MASTDVIRCHARLRLSIRQLYCFRYGGAVELMSRDVSHHGATGTEIQDGSVNDHHLCRFDAGPTQRWSPTPWGMMSPLVPRMEGESEREGVGSPTAAMASHDQFPVPPNPSDVFVGGGRGGEETNHSSFFYFSDLSSPKDECVEERRVSECVEELSALSISYDTKKQSSSLSPTVSKLLDVLLQFRVQSLPVQYLEKPLREGSPEIFCKNLFLKDRRNQYYLVICDENEDMNLKILRRKLKAYRNFSFATPEEMTAILKVHPGGVTPFALMYGSARDVRVAMTTDLTTDSEALLNFHPLDHTLTLPVKFDQLKKFLAHFRFDLEILDMET